MSDIELTQKTFLIGLVLVPVLAYFFHRSLVDSARWQRLCSLVCRTAIVVLLVLALSGLTALSTSDEQFVIFLVDRSRSVGEESRSDAERFISEAVAHQGNHQAAYVYFGASPGPLLSQRPEAPPAVDENGTDLAVVVEAAAGFAPPTHVPHLVLLSDGNETNGDVLRTARRFGVAISTVPLRTRTEPELQVSSVAAPPQVRTGDPFHIDVTIDSNHEDECVVELFRGPEKVEERRVKVRKGETAVQFQSVSQDRLTIYRASVRGYQKDTLLDNNSGSGMVFSAGKPRVLLIDKDPTSARRHLAQALEQEGIEVDVRPPQGLSDDLTDLQNYDLVVFSNVPATSNVPGATVSPAKMVALRTYVKELGGGFIMVGGKDSFGLGGYYKSPLEEILPVYSDFEKEKEKPSLAMVLIIDRSGSMAGEKMELAKAAASSAVELLGPNDQVGVIAFDSESTWVSEIRRCTDKNSILERISTIQAGGGTVLHPSMEQAYEHLRSTIAKLKHVIVLTDGEFENVDFTGIATSMAGSSITVSTVAVGEGADKVRLEEIARLGRGRYHFTDDASNVPQIFARETMTASDSGVKNELFMPHVVQPTPVLAGIDFEAGQPLLGYVLTRTKPTSEQILVTDKRHPLLSWWRPGLGMSVAFTSDATPDWAQYWISNWPGGYSRFWAQVARHAMRSSEARGFAVQIARQGSRATITLDAVDDKDGKFLNQGETELTVIDPGMAVRKLSMTQTAPGRYAATIDASRSGSYHLELAQKQQGKVAFRQSRGLVVGYPDELRIRPTNEPLLEELARITGGHYRPTPQEVFAPLDRTALRPTPLWPYLLLAAACLFALDVGLRRIELSTLWRRKRKSMVASASRRH